MTGAELRNARIRCGLLQKQLGKRVGLSRSTISQYESGRTPINPLKAILLADVLKRTKEKRHKGVDFSTDGPNHLEEERR